MFIEAEMEEQRPVGEGDISRTGTQLVVSGRLLCGFPEPASPPPLLLSALLGWER